jgi:hypothetical protein
MGQVASRAEEGESLFLRDQTRCTQPPQSPFSVSVSVSGMRC